MAKKEDKFCVLDTNILVYALDADSDHHAEVRNHLEQLHKTGYRFCLTEQIVRETLVVVTQSRLTHKPVSSREARLLGWHLLFQMVLLHSNNFSRLTLLDLIEKYDLKGNIIHDANIVAVMVSHGVKELYTCNKKDFPYDEISLIK
ncbi:MAG: PIN domain-containing protein [Deltaproteobacteria bacterium]|nr:PIN domain-containing protein [Deltaproteobacteria bacterium]